VHGLSKEEFIEEWTTTIEGHLFDKKLYQEYNLNYNHYSNSILKLSIFFNKTIQGIIVASFIRVILINFIRNIIKITLTND
jgi:hypothetical protein